MNKNEIIAPNRGMVWDEFSEMAQEGSFKRALNYIPVGLDGKKTPIGKNEGSTLLNVAFAPGFKVVGFRKIPELKRVIYFLHNPFAPNVLSPTGKGISAIAEVNDYNCVYGVANFPINDNCGCHNYAAIEKQPLETVIPFPCNSYNIIRSSTCLNFNQSYPVRIEHDYVGDELRLYFTDEYNNRRFVYLKLNAQNQLYVMAKFHTVVGYDECNAPIYSSVLDCNKIKVQPDLNPICINFMSEIPGGKLPAGMYQFFVALATVNGYPMTKYSPATNGINLFQKKLTFNTNYDTNSGIALEIGGLTYNTIYEYYNIVVAATVDNVTQYRHIATLPISTTQFNYTGFENDLAILSENDILRDFAYYKTAKNVTQSNNYLIWHGMAEYSKGNWQRVANLLRVNWQTMQMPLGYYGQSYYSQRYRTYPRDEVIALGIIIGFTNGEETNVLHIPGRAPISSDLQEVNNNDSINIPNCITDEFINKNWSKYSTATVTETPHQPFKECEETVWERGTFGYYQSTRLYPNNALIWGDLCNQPIRHHKMPNCKTSPIHDDAGMIYPIGIKLDHISLYNAVEQCVTEGLITTEQKNRISYYRIVRGNRVGNKSVIAKGLFYDVNTMKTYDTSNSKDFQSDDYLYPNYGFNDLNPDPFISSDYATYELPDTPIDTFKTQFNRTGRYTFHSPDTHFRNPSVGDILQMESLEYGTAQIHFRELENHAKFKFLTTLSYALSLITGTSYSMSALNKEKKTQNRKDYWYSTNNDTDQYSLKRMEVYPSVKGGGGASVWSIVTTPGTMGGLTTSGSVSKTADYNVGNKKMGAPGNTLNVMGTMGPTDYQNLLKQYGVNYLSEETFDQTTGDKYDFIPNITGLASNPYKAGMIYGEKQKINPLFGIALGTGLDRITTLMTLSLLEMQKIIELIESLIPLKNHAVQYEGIGTYTKSSFVNINNGNFRRYLLDSAYLTSEIQSIDERINISTYNTISVKFNNWLRESSLYLKHHGALFPMPDIVDNSKITMSNAGLNRFKKHDFNRTISAYYGSIKSYSPSQYGSIYDIRYVETGHCPFRFNHDNPVEHENAVFGGDTFINAFSIKRKHPFFVMNAYNMPNNSDWFYEDYPNVGYPNYYFNTKVPMGSRLRAQSSIDFQTLITSMGANATIQNLFGVPKNRLDLAPIFGSGIGQYISKPGEMFYQMGHIYTSAYSLPTFIVESDVNVDLRHGTDNKAGDFYPRQKDTDYWLQEKNVSIREDNQYHYNSTYSKQNNFKALTSDNPDFVPNDMASVNRPNELIYSLSKKYNEKYDPWLVYRPLDRYLFDNKRGRLTQVAGIESDKILCLFENGMSIHNAYVTIQTSVETAIMGTGGMFQTKPQDFLQTDLGYMGSQHISLLNTDIGHLWCDCERGAVWLLPPGGSGPMNLADLNNNSFFKNNLPFRILKDFPIGNQIDNPLKGIGISMVDDKRFKRILITKLDYQCINRDVKFDNVEKCFYINTGVLNQRLQISLHDKRYFIDKSFTVGFYYNRPDGMYWCGFYSYKPNFYVGYNDHFQSGLNSYALTSTQSSVWDHNLTNKSFQVIYGKLEPFEVDFYSKTDLMHLGLNHIGFKLDVWRYHNEYDKTFIDNIPLNMACVWNDRQCSGMLSLHAVPENDMKIVYPKFNADTNRIEIKTNKDKGVWYFNQFNDRIANPHANIPFLLYNSSQTRPYVNIKAIDFSTSVMKEVPISGSQNYVRLGNDKHSNYEMVLQFIIENKN